MLGVYVELSVLEKCEGDRVGVRQMEGLDRK